MQFACATRVCCHFTLANCPSGLPLLTLQQAANDFRADPMLYEACKDDAENLCKDVKHGGGRVQACLVGCEWQGGRTLRLMLGHMGNNRGC